MAAAHLDNPKPRSVLLVPHMPGGPVTAVPCPECGYRMHELEDDCINCLHLAGEWPPEHGNPWPGDA